MTTATAQSHPNIAFIKYWGNRDQALRLPSNGSISMNLDGLCARTTVVYDPALAADILIINRRQIMGVGLERVQRFMDATRLLAGVKLHASVRSEVNFPTGTGIASSAAAFAALALAGTRALGLILTEVDLSRLARLGSGSACRSIPGGFVEWQPGSGDKDSYAFSIANAGHWNLVDHIAVVSARHKPVGSSHGHVLADTSPLQLARVKDTPRRLAICRQAILERNFHSLAEIVEHDSNLMHAVMISSRPSLLYWAPASITIMRAVLYMRRLGLSACYTLDAGPNVHVITESESSTRVLEKLRRLPAVCQVLTAQPGGPAHLAPDTEP